MIKATRTFRFNKLGRHGIYKRWLNEGVTAKLRPLDDAAYRASLLEKLQEETTEVIQAANPQELKEELGDVLEVIHALAQDAGFSFESVDEERKKKREQRGGFEQRIFVETVEFPEGHPTIAYCLQHPHRYPEIKKDT